MHHWSLSRIRFPGILLEPCLFTGLIKKFFFKKSMLINWKFEYNIQEDTIPQEEGETISWII